MRKVSFLCGIWVIACVAGLGANAQTAKDIYTDPSQPIEKRVDALVGSMTLEEKVAQTQNHAIGIPRLGVPEYDYWSEGLHGIARSGYATLFPQAIGLAATWDTPLIHDVSTVISTEARAKFNQAIRDDVHSIFFGLTIWSPNINIFRDPRWGRGQETYGEDPYLTSRIGVAFVKGLQGTDPEYYRAIATPKHFAVHSGPESLRHKFNVNVSPHDLEDTYLPAFRATITEGHADSIMCAYNAIDGVPACANTNLLVDHLRRDWKFQGFVTSDCGAIGDFYESYGHKYSPNAAEASAIAVKTGTDTTCGTEYKALPEAVKDGKITEAEIDTAVKRLFTARFKLGLFDPPSKVKYAQFPYSLVDSEEHRELSLKTAHEAIVLLKNDGTLPLAAGKYKRVAVVGPNAVSLAAIEGNYNAIPSHPVYPLDGVTEAFKGRATVAYAQGSPYVDTLPLPVPRTMLHPAKGSKEVGLEGEYFNNGNLSGAPVAKRIDKQVDFDWHSAAPVPGVSAKDFSVRWTGVLTAPKPGKYTFTVHQGDCFPCHDKEQNIVYIDGKQVLSRTTDDKEMWHGGKPPSFEVDFTSVAEHEIRIEYVHQAPLFGAELTFEWTPPADVLREEAEKIAKSSDLVVAFVGLSPNLEGEEMRGMQVQGFSGGDRTDVALPKAQEDLIEAVAATGKPVVVVLMSGSAVALNWAQEHAAAVLEAWYPGEVGGTAIADVLTGKYNPAGRLPLTFYKSIDQLPDFTEYSMKGRTYRYFSGEPLYKFGYGLSYTKFAYSDLKLSTSTLQAGKDLTAEVTVRNTGKAAGDEVAQLYLVPPQADGAPLRTLQGFKRVHLAPGESTKVSFDLGPRQLSTVDEQGIRSVKQGEYTVYVGGGQPDEQASMKQTLTISGSEELPK